MLPRRPPFEGPAAVAQEQDRTRGHVHDATGDTSDEQIPQRAVPARPGDDQASIELLRHVRHGLVGGADEQSLLDVDAGRPCIAGERPEPAARIVDLRGTFARLVRVGLDSVDEDERIPEAPGERYRRRACSRGLLREISREHDAHRARRGLARPTPGSGRSAWGGRFAIRPTSPKRPPRRRRRSRRSARLELRRVFAVERLSAASGRPRSRPSSAASRIGSTRARTCTPSR